MIYFCPKCTNTLDKYGKCTDCLWYDNGYTKEKMKEYENYIIFRSGENNEKGIE